MEPDRDLEIVKQHTAALHEHFDSVQIFCTRYESKEKGTIRVTFGLGDWFARYGVTRLWTDGQDILDSANKIEEE